MLTKRERIVGAEIYAPLALGTAPAAARHGKQGYALDEVDHHSAVGDALGILIHGLAPFVERVFADALPPGMEWTETNRAGRAIKDLSG
jgi:hypothetical protein